MREAVNIYLEENGKQLQFRIKPMSAFQSLMWSKKALSVFDIVKMRQNVTDKENAAEELGAMFLSRLAEMPDDVFEALVEGLIKCCCIVKENIPVQLSKDNLDGFFDDRNTLIQLCAEALKVNNFFQMSGADGLKASPAPVEIKRRA